MILLLWIVVGVRHLKYLKSELAAKWEDVSDILRKRHDIVPNLIETLKFHSQSHGELISKLIAIRQKASREYNNGAKKIEYEYDLSTTIKELLDLHKQLPELARDTNFLELRTQLDYLGSEMKTKSDEYNESIRQYNKNIKFVLLRPLAAVLRHETANIFEIEI